MASARIAREKLSEMGRQLRFLPRATRLLLRAAGRRAVAWLVLLALSGLAPAALVYLARPLVDGFAASMGGGADWQRLAPIATIAAGIAALLLAMEALRSAADWLRSDLAARVEDHLAGLIHDRSLRADLAFYETPEFHDHLHRARDEARYRPLALLDSGGALLQGLVTLSAMAALLASYGAGIALALLASALPALLVVVRFAALHHAWRNATTVDERRANYYDWLMTSGEAAAEVRLFGLASGLKARYAQTREQLRKGRLGLARRHALADVIASLAALFVAAACVALVAWRALQGEASAGDVVLFYLSFSQGQRLMRSLLGNVGQIYYNVLFLGNLFEFLDLEPGVREPTVPRPLGEAAGVEVRFEDVTFRYPGTDRLALRNFSLRVAAGQSAAIVGVNGAGKSTLLKLLCRFYDPQAGHVRLGGTDVRELRIEDVRRSVSALFQQPMRFNATVAENISPGNEAPDDRVRAAAAAAGADRVISRLAGGYAAMLGRWFTGGAELSVGEWQRLGLARAFARESPVIVLDEPTSAMDSWTEAEWESRLRTLAAGRTVIMVTHRFTTAMRADVIHVMDEGRIVESGTHAELLAHEGRYAQSWRAQEREAVRTPASLQATA